MLKIIIGFITSVILTGVLFMGPLSQVPTTAQADGSSPAETPPDILEFYQKSLTSPLREAGNEIRGKDMGQFYGKLLREYELNELPQETAQSGLPSLTRAIPDIKKIDNAAITLPLREAGRNIQDEDIARFYYQLLESAGWEIEPR